MMHVRRFLKEYRQAIPHWPELHSWRHNAIHVILIVLAVAGLPAWGAVVVGALRSGEVTPLIGLYAAVYLALLALALLPRIDPGWRIWGLLILGYVNGAASLLRLGILEEAQWREKSISFQPRDICLLYTDGVTEAQNSAGDFFERGRLAALLRRNAGRSAEEIRGVLLGELAQFTGEADPHDDVTLVVMTHGMMADAGVNNGARPAPAG